MNPNTNSLTVDRKQLATALKQVGRVAQSRSSKPILRGVRLTGSDGHLSMSATDAEIAITVTVPADGQLDACVVEAAELAKRVVAGKSTTCTIERDTIGEHLVVNGGMSSHSLPTMDSGEFPVIVDQPIGKSFQVAASELKTALHTSLAAAARESTRYAINDVLIDAHKTGVRFVATDGRRMVVCDLEHTELEVQGSVILTRPMAVLLDRLISKRDKSNLIVHVDGRLQPEADKTPPRLFFSGSNWLLSGRAGEGVFPDYRQVIPNTGARFVIDRSSFLAAVTEVSASTTRDQPALRMVIDEGRLHISAASGDGSNAGADIPARCIGDTGAAFCVGVNAQFLRDALKTLQSDQVVLDGTGDSAKRGVVTCAIQVYPYDNESPRWIIMPVNLHWPDPTVEKPVDLATATT